MYISQLNQERTNKKDMEEKRQLRVAASRLIEHYALKVQESGPSSRFSSEISDPLLLLVFLGLKLANRLAEKAASKITTLCEILSEGYLF
mmetsp:Transcript_30338/g.46420  ORF Transcript_30338/g.46420 Transcript_30338/m.46420 type:complete len:90 (+) Transcript_30338:597-866(+)